MSKPELSLLELVATVAAQAASADQQPTDGATEQLAVQVAVDLLRLGLGPLSRRELVSPAARAVWIEASLILEDERAQRSALASSSPGQRLEDVRGYAVKPVDRLSALIAANDAAADAARAALGLV